MSRTGSASCRTEAGTWVVIACARSRTPPPCASAVERLITDGPFAETRERIAGFDLIEVGDLDEAIEVAAAHPMARFGRVEVRPIWPL